MSEYTYGITRTLRTQHNAELSLARELRSLAKHHEADHEVHHVALDIALWSLEHAAQLAKLGRAHGVELAADDAEDPEIGHTADAPGPLRLLDDLCTVYLAASANSLRWEMLAQAAQAGSDADLLKLASACHPQTLRQIRWANTLIKTQSPQAMTSI